MLNDKLKMESKFNQLSAKRKITQFAEKATQKIKQNANIAKNIAETEKYIDLTKNLLRTFSKSNEPPQTQQKRIKGELLSIIDLLRSKNSKLKKDNQTAQAKQSTLLKTLKTNCQQSSDLDNVRADNFILYNALLEKESKITKINNDLQIFRSDYGLTEYARDYYIYDPADFIDEFEEILKDKQDFLLKQSRSYNKMKNRFITLIKEKNALKKMINDLLEANRVKKDIKNTNECNTKPNTNDNDRRDEVNIDSDKQIEQQQQPQQQPGEEGEGEDEVDIFEDVDIELNSDDDADYESKLSNLKMLTNTYEDKVRNQVPKIDLKQIEFNKMKIKPEVDINSLERRDNNESVDSQIRNLNDKIKLLKKRKSQGDEKIARYSNYFERISQKIDTNQKGGRSSTVFTISNSNMGYNSNPLRNNSLNTKQKNTLNNVKSQIDYEQYMINS